MKLLINASTLSSTGVVQVAVSFINECKKYNENSYHVVLSHTAHSQIDFNLFPDNFTFYKIQDKPRYLIKGYKARKYLQKIEHEINPDCVFSVFGPSYWSPLKPHLMGYASPHYIYPDSPYFQNISKLNQIKIKIYKTIHKYFLLKNGNFYVSETEDVSKRAINFLGCNSDHMFTVSNTYSEYFESFIPDSANNLLPFKQNNEFRFLSLCAIAPHKNLEILNHVIPLLNEDLKSKIKFILTVDENLFEKNFNEEAKKSIINIGRIDVSRCPQLYHECDALFLPTLLECFSANYPEAMKMNKPILTSNISFATDVCQQAALYFDPLNPKDIAEKIKIIISSPDLYQLLIIKGNERLKSFLTAAQRAKRYLEICSIISIKSISQ